MSDNNITITGNMTRDPELRFTQGGQAVANFGVAVNRRYMQHGEWVDAPTTFFNCVAWRELGENLAASCVKGTRVVVTGRMESREYEHEGTKRIAWEVQVDECAVSLRFADSQSVTGPLVKK